MFKMSAFSVDKGRQIVSTRRWRGSQQIGPVRTAYGYQTLAQLVDVLDYAVVHTLHALFWTFLSGFGCAKIIEIC